VVGPDGAAGPGKAARQQKPVVGILQAIYEAVNLHKYTNVCRTQGSLNILEINLTPAF
jgi:hypothetical protein